MDWEWIIFTRFVFVSFFVVLLKKVSGLPSRIRNLCWQFFFCALVSVFVLLVYQDNYYFDKRFIFVGIVFMITNSLGNFCYWRAVDLNFTKSALFLQGTHYVSLSLGFLFLKEIKYLNPGIIFGAALCLTAGLLFYYSKERSKNKALLLFMIGTCFFWGADDFFSRKFAAEGIESVYFLTARYIGTCVGFLVILAFANMTRNSRLNFFNKKDLEKTPVKNKLVILLIMSICMAWVPMILEYWARQKAPLIATGPYNLVLGLISPLFISYLVAPILVKTNLIPSKIFIEIIKERKGLAKKEKIGFVLGLIGIIIVFFSY